MDVSRIFWDYVDMMTKTSFEDAKDIRLFQIFECCEILNRQLMLDETALVNASQIKHWYRGVHFDKIDQLFVFKSYKDLLYCTKQILEDCVSKSSNTNMSQKLDKLNKAITTIENSKKVFETNTVPNSLLKVRM